MSKARTSRPAANWQLLSLRQAGVSLLDCEHRTPRAAEEGNPYIAIPQVKQGRLDLSDARRITDEDFLTWTKKTKPQEYDVILSRRCNPGDTAFVPSGLECALGQNLVLLRSNGTKVFLPFLRWLLRGPQWWEQVNTFINVGAVFNSLKCADIPNFQLSIPPFGEQRRIADILGTLDDKIELNQRMNETLEAMARRLFKSWFVDFDPVHAKAALRRQHPKLSNADLSRRALPNLTPEIAELFPDSFDDSTLGPIPQGWRVSTVGEMVTVVGGSTPSTSEPSFWGGDVAFATPRDMASLTSPALLSTERRITRSGLEKISSGLLPSATVLLSSRAPIGYLAIAEIPVAVNQGFIAMICDRGVPNHYVLHWARQNMDTIIGNANGTTFLEISKKNFRPIVALRPETSILSRFAEAASLLHHRIIANLRESETIAKKRDRLLPHLLAGELLTGISAEHSHA